MVNKVMLVGRLGRDPTILCSRKTGSPYALMSVATNHWTPQGTETEWHSVIVFGQAATALRDYGRKGRLVYVEGRLQYYTKVDKENGQETQVAQVCSTVIQFLDNKQRTEEDACADNVTDPHRHHDDDIPF